MNSKVQDLPCLNAAMSVQDLAQISQLHQFQDIEMDKQIFRNGMSNLGAAVNVITTQGIAGHAGFTA